MPGPGWICGAGFIPAKAGASRPSGAWRYSVGRHKAGPTGCRKSTPAEAWPGAGSRGLGLGSALDAGPGLDLCVGPGLSRPKPAPAGSRALGDAPAAGIKPAPQGAEVQAGRGVARRGFSVTWG